MVIIEKGDFVWNIPVGVIDINIDKYLQPHTTHSFVILSYLAASFDHEYEPSSGYYTGTWVNAETMHRNLEISLFYIKNTLKMYVK
jgi:hypothetical protein